MTDPIESLPNLGTKHMARLTRNSDCQVTNQRRRKQILKELKASSQLKARCPPTRAALYANPRICK